MNADQAWKEHLELDEKYHKAELKFAIAVLNCEKKRGNGPVNLGDIAHLLKERLIAKYEMNKSEEELIKSFEYLDSINFIA